MPRVSFSPAESPEREGGCPAVSLLWGEVDLNSAPCIPMQSSETASPKASTSLNLVSPGDRRAEPRGARSCPVLKLRVLPPLQPSLLCLLVLIALQFFFFFFFPRLAALAFPSPFFYFHLSRHLPSSSPLSPPLTVPPRVPDLSKSFLTSELLFCSLSAPAGTRAAFLFTRMSVRALRVIKHGKVPL